MNDQANRGMLDAYGVVGCGCWTCVDEIISARPFPENIMYPFVICGTCGNKRCPRAQHHDSECSGSNAPGQVGSPRYPAHSEFQKLAISEMLAQIEKDEADTDAD